jgi:hypothetical protein
VATLVAVVVAGATATMQQRPAGFIDPQPILAAAAKAIGTDNLRCVTVSGTRGYGGAVGQQPRAAEGVDWPRIPFISYTRSMNWDARTMKEEFDRKPGQNPASWKYGLVWL